MGRQCVYSATLNHRLDVSVRTQRRQITDGMSVCVLSDDTSQTNNTMAQ